MKIFEGPASCENENENDSFLGVLVPSRWLYL